MDGLAGETSSYVAIVHPTYNVPNVSKVVRVFWVEDGPLVVDFTPLWLCTAARLLKLCIIARLCCRLCLPRRLSPYSWLGRGGYAVVGAGRCVVYYGLVLEPEPVFLVGLSLGLASRGDAHHEMILQYYVFWTWLVEDRACLAYLWPVLLTRHERTTPYG